MDNNTSTPSNKKKFLKLIARATYVFITRFIGLATLGILMSIIFIILGRYEIAEIIKAESNKILIWFLLLVNLVVTFPILYVLLAKQYAIRKVIYLVSDFPKYIVAKQLTKVVINTKSNPEQLDVTKKKNILAYLKNTQEGSWLIRLIMKRLIKKIDYQDLLADILQQENFDEETTYQTLSTRGVNQLSEKIISPPSLKLFFITVVIHFILFFILKFAI